MQGLPRSNAPRWNERGTLRVEGVGFYLPGMKTDGDAYAIAQLNPDGIISLTVQKFALESNKTTIR